MINYVKGNLFDHIVGKKNIMVPHMANVFGSMGAGFALELAKKYPNSERLYREHCKQYRLDNYAYYSPQVLFTEESFGHVANMICQLRLSGSDRNFYYRDLGLCMDIVTDECINLDINNIFTVKFGSGLANGNWDFIEELIKECWNDFNVNIFYL